MNCNFEITSGTVRITDELGERPVMKQILTQSRIYY